ncbi:MAG: sigma-70 family RNA polymerase sigma factor [Verrucomicrobiota bacterium]
MVKITLMAMPESTTPQSGTPLDPERWVVEHGDVLFRYALARVRDTAVAEDLVQDTFLAGWKNRQGFTGQSAERSWLIGILKHKIVDHIRHASLERAQFADEPLPARGGDQFDEAGHWKIAAVPKTWADDAATTWERQEFWQVLDGCLEKLPPRTAQAFVLRELDGEAGEEVCKVLNISPTNFWVLLHRARMQLRQCLELNWFGK